MSNLLYSASVRAREALHRFSSPVLYIIPIIMLTTACTERMDFVGPSVPDELRQPCELVEREYETLRDVALLLTDYAESVECANGRIVAIDAILTEYEAALEQDK
ncbi:MAG: hypothetical protein EBT13_07235 [Rhodobacteraceae bacterium]|nr:hypothetical protein [Paracoccaceae bacterium]